MSIAETTKAPFTPPAKKKKRQTVEKIMLLFTLFFLTGILLYSVLTGPVRGIAVGLVACAVAYVLLKPAAVSKH